MQAKRKSLTIWERAAKHGWNYTGDISLEYGGTFYKDVAATDYVEAVRVTPCSDAGGPDNIFHIDNGSIYLGSFDQRARALNSMGYYDGSAYSDERNRCAMHGPYTLDIIVEACLHYQGVECDHEENVRIGGKSAFWRERGDGWNPKPDVILPGNARLDNYIFKVLT